MIVVAMIGILAAALFPNMTGYLKRARDAARASDLNNISVGIAAYEIDKEILPPHVSGCYPSQILLSRGYTKKDFISPSGSGYDEGCGTGGRYAYGVSTGNVLDPQSSLLLSMMENQNGGNYTGSTSGMTGDLTLLGHFNATFLVSKGTGSTYILRPSAGSGGTAGSPPPAAVNGSCGALIGLCNTGTPANINGGSCGGSATWTCNGQYGGSTASCSVANGACPPVNGACGSAAGVGTLTAPSSGLCNAGTQNSVVTSPGNYSWNCNGQNGGTNTGCTAPRYYTVASCTARGQTYTGGSTYSTCNSTDKIVCTGVGVGNTWSMCNVGSTVAGTTSASYGYMFQWGRNVPFLSTGTVPTVAGPLDITSANATGSFIMNGGGTQDWLTPQDRNLWGGSGTTWTSGTYISLGSPSAMQGPCASGYHVPTLKELCDTTDSLMNTSGCMNQNNTIVQSTLIIPFAGRRHFSSSSLVFQGSYGDYWLSSAPSGAGSSTVGFDSTVVNQSGNFHPRAGGLPIRCMKN